MQAKTRDHTSKQGQPKKDGKKNNYQATEKIPKKRLFTRSGLYENKDTMMLEDDSGF